jgi:hypothetical protein
MISRKTTAIAINRIPIGCMGDLAGYAAAGFLLAGEAARNRT